ncbi:hypothetical protein [Pseudoduganella violacea]|uniref:DUF4365 domain-containing protein n=1 Tax=Pseudoduganella violacea TaxID=1715466 RepID=A0A7W5FTM1_9BURK|nr:hypothetical protein [Pseudoduganella violacea]MBB3119015.1 hypothetical protein [Pseudoduganella violacea]
MDTTGWDFFVEFAFSPNVTRSPFSLHEAALECKIQVKATDKRDRKCAISLANLRRLVTAPVPTFFIFIEFNEMEAPQRVFLKHVDSALCSRALSRIHEAEASDKGDRLHKMTMTVRYGDTDALSEVSGAALAAALRGHIGESMAEYSERKRAHLEQAGFEEGSATVCITVEGEENIANFINATMGIESGVPVSEIVAHHKRFGKTASRPFIEEAGGVIEFVRTEPDHQGVLTISADNLRGHLSCRGLICPDTSIGGKSTI